MEQVFVDFGYNQCNMSQERICGDTVRYCKIHEEQRIVAILSDGLGHGIRANVQSAMTASMAMRFMQEETNLLEVVKIMMNALPVNSEKQLAYATFSILNSSFDGHIRLIEMENPPFILLRGNRLEEIEPETKLLEREIKLYQFKVQANDRIIIFSDGITQAGTGSKRYPTGWGRERLGAYILDTLERRPDVSSQELAELIQRKALSCESTLQAGDDMSCVVIYYRKPKKLILFTGPPVHKERDGECAAIVNSYEGAKVVAGGTTGEIIARELRRKISVDFSSQRGELPPTANIEGIDLVTEGIFTLERCAKNLESHTGGNKKDGASRMAMLLQSHDVIDFLVGTRVNEAHQSPDLPPELELRRNIVRRIAKILQEKYLKEVNIRYI